MANFSDSAADNQPSLCCGRWTERDLWLDTRVQTRSSRLEVGRVENGRLKLRLTAAPVDGKANQQACKLLAKSFGVGISRVKLINGQTHKNKQFLIQEPSRLPPEVFKILTFFLQSMRQNQIRCSFPRLPAKTSAQRWFIVWPSFGYVVDKMRLLRILMATLATAALITSCGQDNSGQSASRNIQAEPNNVTSKAFGDYVLHFNAISTDQLPPEVARAHNIVRSKNRAMLTVSIIKSAEAAPGASQAGTVSATAANLTGQLKNLTLREIREDEAIYYIGDVAVANSETLVFNIDVIPENETDRLSVRFSRQFFAD